MTVNKFFYFLIITFITSTTLCNLPEKPIVAVITSYNNASWVKKNLDSVLAQKYNNFRIIYIDDCSEDSTGNIVEHYIQEHNLSDKVTLIRNQRREGKLYNTYNVYHSIDDWDIIIQIDGDDWLSGPNVFNEINKAYNSSDIWFTYGQFKNSDGKIGYARPVPQHIISSGSFRKAGCVYMPLRTFYAWLFKQIKLQDLITDIFEYKGKFYPFGNDVAFTYPMVELAQNNFKFISTVLYIRNLNNPISNSNLSSFISNIKELRRKILKEIITRKQYLPIKRYCNKLKQLDDAKADCIIMTTNLSQTNTMLTSIAYHISNLGNVYIICQSTEKNRNNLEKLKDKFPTVMFLDLASIDNKQKRNKVIKALFSSINDYVLIGKDTFTFSDHIDCNQCIKDLEQTFAYGIYLNLNLINGPFTETNEKSKVPCQRVKNDIYAWKFKNNSAKEKNYENISMSLHRKADILTCINDTEISSIDDLINAWEKRSVSSESVGLFYRDPKVIPQKFIV